VQMRDVSRFLGALLNSRGRHTVLPARRLTETCVALRPRFTILGA
jgi:hypothetical protein